MAPGGVVVARQQEIDAGLLTPAAGAAWLTFGRAISGDGALVEDDAITLRRRDARPRFAISNPRVRGEHNRENLAAAVLAASASGVAPDEIERGILAYPGIAHRLESVGSVGGVLYVNDSKGTNVDATVKALGSFDTPILLIAGGLDKGTGYGPMVEAARGRVRALFTIGQAAPLIERALGPVVDEVVSSGTLDQAVRDAAARARPEEVVLLSPACASFDQFNNFEQRGRAFVSAVRSLKERA
jgi:UDP-N-acetylmuramoylalanine--D-glutamate ligase